MSGDYNEMNIIHNKQEDETPQPFSALMDLIGKSMAVDPASFCGFLHRYRAKIYPTGRPRKATTT